MSYQSSRTTRTYQYSSGGPGSGNVTETRTVTQDGNTRTETRNYGGDGGDFNDQFGKMQFNVDVNSHPVDGRGGHSFNIRASHSHPVESRFSKGWGWGKKKDKDLPPNRSAPPPPRQTRDAVAAPAVVDGQTYEEIRDACLKAGTLFEDPEFPAVDTSIFFSKRPPRPFQWKRPGEICGDPEMFVGGASRFDVKQGELGDCWLLAAIANLAQSKELMYRVVPRDQSFKDQYAGVFHFQFWQYGDWTDVIVDDRLPTYNNRLVFMHSEDRNEFWTALLEKAYAKMEGSYEALKGGSTSEAMEDFTGGLTEMMDLRQAPPNLLQIMLKAHERGSLMGCSIDADPNQLEAELTNGLIMGHAYSLTAVKLVEVQTSRSKGKIPLVRIRNPWGNECEWKGAWSDQSREWKLIPEEEKKEIGLTFDDDGEFWMSFQDFVKNFQKLEICNLGPDSAQDEQLDLKSRKKWEAAKEGGQWIKRVNAGGCRNYLETFWTNPQYRLTVTDPDEDDDEELCTAIIALMQKGRRKKRKEGVDMLTIGYAVYRIKDPEKQSGQLDLNFFKYNASVAKSPSFINMREVCGRHKLAPGTYVILPTTFEPNQEANFMLRMYTEKANITQEVDEETGISDVQKAKSANNTPEITSPKKVIDVQEEDGGRAEKTIVEEGMVPIPVAEETQSDRDAEAQIRAQFKQIAGEDLEIDAYELRDILDQAYKREFRFDGFSSDTCRSMVASLDADQSGKLGFDEFKKLWTNLRLWKSVFVKYDADKSGTFNSYEMRQALHRVGLRLSNATFKCLVMRYSHKDGTLHFDDYIHCIVKLKTMFELFEEMKTKDGHAKFGMDEFIQTTMYS